MATGLWPAATIGDCVRRAPLRRRRQVHLPRAGRRTTRRRLSAPQQLRRRQRRERPCRLRWRDIRPIGGGVDGRGGARGGDASGLSAASGLGGHAHWSRKVCVWFFGVSCIVSAGRVRVVRSRDSSPRIAWAVAVYGHDICVRCPVVMARGSIYRLHTSVTNVGYTVNVPL